MTGTLTLLPVLISVARPRALLRWRNRGGLSRLIVDVAALIVALTLPLILLLFRIGPLLGVWCLIALLLSVLLRLPVTPRLLFRFCRPLGIEVYELDKRLLEGWKPPESPAYKGAHGMKLQKPAWEA